MRLLHTSDWHLGRTFHGMSLRAEQSAFLDHLVAVARAEDVDTVLVAGDVYDRALPSLEAVALFDEVLHRLAEIDVEAVLISGNHDSAPRLGVGAGLIGRAGIHLRTDPAAASAPVLLADEFGDIAFYGLPYLEPTLVREVFGVERAGHAAVLGAAMDRVRADLARRPGTRSVVLAHAFVVGGTGCDSERDITVGGIQDVPASVFDGVDYVALGHLHGAQTITERIRYSGSPLAFSFSEAAHRKSMWLIDLDGEGRPDARRLDCPVPRPLARLRGRLEELLDDPRLERHADAWVQVTLTDPVRPRDPMSRLRRRFPRTLQLTFDPETDGRSGDSVTYSSRLRGRDDTQIGLDFIQHVRGRPAEADEHELLRDAFAAVRMTADGGRAR
ncbi:exonuclease SbcCD subunit D [Wenjunlia tyrosinilytica]|uniref:Nuclease SbcCD subunit D n=1 Tax=Wenjunlia tyrosinilytica TaxID=1544741 RepID=A0A918DVU9_9ACTN|nr:exonuclease SbcCD subunit D [Wenjunlia tyrosinilytica]GGO83918.1 nuclease SbcCD subunit D [Wenjunlia tyrosinilytica]